ncbi:MAG: gamma-glutamyltransferase, partial [Pseudomonadales bacterium]
IVYDYKGYQVYTASVPSNAFAAFTCLGLMDPLQYQAFEHNSDDYLHLLAEIANQSYSSRLLYSVDPELDPFPKDKIFSADHLQTIAKSIYLTSASIYELPFVAPGSNNTTHFVVADGAGNIVSATQTLGNLFGSRI